MKVRFFLLIVLFFSGLDLKAQGINLGIPPTWNFPNKVYHAGTQNWDAAQDIRGVMYFANNVGLLQYDGNNWNCLPVTNHTIVRSVAIAEDNRIYVGAQSEFGYYFPDSDGFLRYHSLVSLLPEAMRHFEDVWDICFWKGDVFFRTNQMVFQYSGDKVKVHQPASEFTAMYLTGNGILLQANFTSLLIFKNEVFEPHIDYPAITSAITGVIPWKSDTLLLSTLKNGIFYIHNNTPGKWTTLYDPLLKEKRVYTACILPGYQLAIGTSLDGLLVLDDHRRIYRHLTKKTGLQNNNILCTFADRGGNIWLGLDNGIDCVILDAPFSSIIPDRELLSTGYTAAVFDDYLYMGVSDGIYVAPWQSYYDPEKGPFIQKIQATDGQAWGLKTIGNQLLLGHHEGAFQLNGTTARRFSSIPGSWTFLELSADYLLGGNYNGLTLYRKSADGWVLDQKLPGLNESCRIMVKDAEGIIWVSHPYRGVYRIEWQPEQKEKLKVQFLDSRQGLPSNLNNYVYEIAGKAVFATNKGVYRYDKVTGKFIPDQDFIKNLGADRRVKYLKEDARGNIWYVVENEVGMLMVNDLGLRKEARKKVFSELDNKLVGGFEFIYPYDDNNVIFGAEQGFIHYNAAASSSQDSLQVILTKVTATGFKDSLIFGGWHLDNGKAGLRQADELAPVLERRLNNLQFIFSAPDYKDPGSLQYRTQLKGLTEKWSEWSAETKQNYTNLGAGNYTFMVQARSKDGRESAIVTYSFRIQPPWYGSTLAFIIYFLLLAGLIAGSLLGQKRKFEKEKDLLKEQHEAVKAQHIRQVEQTKAALIQIQNEKLEAEISFKNKELASATLHLVQKGEILVTIQEALNQILAKSKNPEVKKETQHLINLLNFDATLDDGWEQFAHHFDLVHVDFLKRLREKYPQLSANDEKLSAYLRMNLSTKETAQLMNISVRGVEASRYRLRKKLHLSNEANLVEFMMKV
jgi:DNA-binding CsgD family transcriptional regulator